MKRVRWEMISELSTQATQPLGVPGRGVNRLGAAPHPDYYDGRIRDLAKQLTDEFRTENATTRLSDYWENSPVAQKPMMSLRDIDEAGRFIPARPFGKHRIKGADEKTLIAEALRIVRRQRSRVGELDRRGMRASSRNRYDYLASTPPPIPTTEKKSSYARKTGSATIQRYARVPVASGCKL